ncbi:MULTISPECIES: DUF3325 domain-containing protein [Sphingobium]|uniref:DUF3325 domain-containing protein n=1 Tax=Sphingobium TaxID=165695 RepID=UPI0024319AFE|nr:DUF3325 domain-containing protein [Sphingobium yanoikuyae]
MMMLASLLLCLPALILLALSLPRHHRDLIGTTASFPRERRLRCAGWLLILLSLAIPVAAFGYAVGTASWAGVTAFSTMIVTMAITYRPRWILQAATLSALGAPAVILFAWSI